jgi:hypothetical protein
MSDKPNIPLAQQTANHFYTYLMNYKININVKDPPITEKHKEIMSISISQEQNFVDYLKSSEYQIQVDIINDKPTKDIFIDTDKKIYYKFKKLELFEQYVIYYKKYVNNHSHGSKEIFWTNIKTLIKENKTSIKDNHREQKQGTDITYYLVPAEYVTLVLPIIKQNKSEYIESLLKPDPNGKTIENGNTNELRTNSTVNINKIKAKQIVTFLYAGQKLDPSISEKYVDNINSEINNEGLFKVLEKYKVPHENGSILIF